MILCTVFRTFGISIRMEHTLLELVILLFGAELLRQSVIPTCLRITSRLVPTTQHEQWTEGRNRNRESVQKPVNQTSAVGWPFQMFRFVVFSCVQDGGP